MNVFQAMLYGLVQGVTEFLPVSSTAHLALLPWVLGWSDPGVAFDVAVHLGTAVAVILFFFKDWLRLIAAGFTRPKSPDGKLFWWVVVATVPGGVFGLLLDKPMSQGLFRSPLLIGVMLILMGVALYFADYKSRSKTELYDIGPKRSLTVGIAQVLAVIPGVSRSGVTMAAGRALGVSREAIAKFTFLMSAPIILADGLYHIKDLGGSNMPSALPLAAAIITSGVVGALVIKFLLDYLKRHGFAAFAIYRLIVGAAVIALALARG